jgi:nitroreductase
MSVLLKFFPIFAPAKKIIMTNETLQTIRQRRSVRQYADRQISDEELTTVIEAGLYAPHGSSHEENLFFTVIQNRELMGEINLLAKAVARQREGLRELGSNEHFDCLYHAPTLILVSYNERTVCPETDSAAVLQNMLLAAEAIGLGGCWLYFPLQAFESDKRVELRQRCAIPQGFRPYASMVVGHKLHPAPQVAPRTTNKVFYLR